MILHFAPALILVFGFQQVFGESILETLRLNSTQEHPGFNFTADEIRKLLYGDDARSTECGIRLGFREGKIVGGHACEAGEFPWQVSLQYRTRFFGYRHFCGGAVVGSNWILTAGHCAQAIEPGEIQAIMGSIDLRQTQRFEIRSKIVKAIVHQDYNGNTIENDIALLQTSEPIDLSARNHPILPVCLPEPEEEPVGQAIVSGFGRTDENGGVSSVLRAVEVPLMSDETCQKYYGKRVYPKMICAGYLEGKKDACQGDSGGPLVQVRGDKKSVLVGVVSWGIGCARPNKPGVYTQVSKYVNWIYNTIAANK